MLLARLGVVNNNVKAALSLNNRVQFDLIAHKVKLYVFFWFDHFLFETKVIGQSTDVVVGKHISQLLKGKLPLKRTI